MPDTAIRCCGLSKKFTRGERANSLRDALPGLLRVLSRQRSRDELTAAQFWALQDVSFEVPRGAALGIIGPNGAGKSTLLKLLSSIMVPDRGSMAIEGRLTALIEVGAGFHADLTGRENVFLNGAILGMSRREISRKLGQIVDFAGVRDFIDTPVKRYSSGMQARLGFSVAAHMDPDILLIDEVLAVGDAQFQQRCLEKMRYFANTGRSIVFISHNLQTVAELCPQTMLLMDGRREFCGPTSEAIQRYVADMKTRDTAPQQGSVSLHHVRLLDADGAECGSFKAGVAARLEFDAAIDRPASRYVLGLGLKRVTDGLIVADYNLELPFDDHERGPRSVTIEFDMNLLTGSYAVVLFLVDRETYQKLVYLDFVKVFDVAEPSANAGLVHVSPRVSCHREAVSAVPAGTDS